MNLDTLKISTHAKERYAARIMDRESRIEINSFIVEHEDKIKNDIKKMIEYGELLYSGKPTSDIYERKPVDIYQNGLWIVIVDQNKNNVITLYSIDLGVGDEMNRQYVGKLLDKLAVAKTNLEAVKAEIDSQSNDYKDIITQNEAIIAENRRVTKLLEEQNQSYRGVIDGLQAKVAMADRDVRDIVAVMIGKKVF